MEREGRSPSQAKAAEREAEEAFSKIEADMRSRLSDPASWTTVEDGEGALCPEVDRFFDSLDASFPGAFAPEEAHADGERRRRAAAPDGGLCLEASSFLFEIVIGMGQLAHSHFDAEQAKAALAFVGELLSGETGILEARASDGSLNWARFAKAAELETSPPSLEDGDCIVQARFFGTAGDADHRG